MLPFSELSMGGICKPVAVGCALFNFCESDKPPTEDSMDPDLRFMAFCMGLSFTLANGPVLLVA
jgi:hypothetical protein